jgi:hypothetical protein
MSCGCLQQKSRIKHNESKTRLFHIWVGMHDRCYTPSSTSYPDYGGRGISICEDWKTDFIAFKKWAELNGYNDELTIERIDVNGNYEPSNCRWVSRKTQCNNKRNNHYITYKGRTQTLAQWCEELNLNYGTVKSRINRNHWTVEKAFETKDNARLKLITYKGKTQHLAEWCRELNLEYKKIQARLNESHWSVERAFEE